jgi:hypothetical protein
MTYKEIESIGFIKMAQFSWIKGDWQLWWLADRLIPDEWEVRYKEVDGKYYDTKITVRGLDALKLIMATKEKTKNDN